MALRLPISCRVTGAGRVLGALALAACASPAPAPAGPALARFEFSEPHMGTEFRIVVYAARAVDAGRAAKAAFARVAELDRRLSDYEPASELTRLGVSSDRGAPTAPVIVSEDLWRVLEEGQAVARASEGAFDLTIGPYVQLWRRARRQEALPRASALSAAAPAVGYAKLELGAEHTVRLLAPRMRLDAGGIAKGYALDEVLDLLAGRGLERALVVGGGELRAGAPPPGANGWRVALVGLDGPSEALELSGCALATSGDLEQFVVIDGKRYSHILDPRTGRALSERRLVSVLGPRAIRTDALATAVSVLGPEAGLELVRRTPGYEARVIVAEGVFRTAGFPGALSSGDSSP